jgi:hypothetical protein
MPAVPLVRSTHDENGDDAAVRRSRFRAAAGHDFRRALNANGQKEARMTLGTLLLIIVVLLLIGAIPSWPYSKGWGYAPSGVVGVLLVIVIVLLVAGRI